MPHVACVPNHFKLEGALAIPDGLPIEMSMYVTEGSFMPH
jgi:hypothetical protein